MTFDIRQQANTVIIINNCFYFIRVTKAQKKIYMKPWLSGVVQ